MNKQKICHITTVHPPFDTRIFHKQAKTLVNAGYDVALIAQHDKNETIDGVKIIALPKPKHRLYRMVILTSKAFWLSLKQKAEIYHFHDPEIIPFGLILKILRKKVIYDVHEDVPKDIMPKYWIPKLLRSSMSFLVNLVEKGFSRFFDAVITATDDIFKNFKNHLRCYVIKNYPLLKSFTNIRIEKENTNNHQIIYAGGLAPERGITQIVQTMEFLSNNVKLILCGNFSPECYEKEVKNLKGFEKVEYKGFIDYENLPKYLAQADVGIVTLHPVPSYINSLPVKLFEYMAVGLPVIASNFPLWKEIVEGNKCGICVNPLNPEEIAEAIKYLMEHPDEAKKMGENGRKAVLSKYNWGKEGERLLKVYEELLGGNYGIPAQG